MEKPQWIAIIIAICAVTGIYFAFGLKDPKLGEIELKRNLNKVSTSDEIIIRNAKNSLSKEQNDILYALEERVHESSSDIDRIESLKKLSGKWYDLGYPILSAAYAQDIAEISESSEAWSIAGSTYFVALRNTDVEENKSYAAGKAIQSFEKAISLEPGNLDHRVNLALTYAEYPLKEDPMRGIMMLLDINKSNPDNIPALKALARLGIKTGQYDKARMRLEKVITLDTNDTSAWCLLAQVYKELNLTKEYQGALSNCNKH